MKEPWTTYIPCCCCCRPKRPEPTQPKVDLERGRGEVSISTDNSLDEVSPAQRAIDLALRHSTELGAEDTRQEEANPPPSYDSVLKDDDRRNPNAQRRGPAELHGTSMAPRYPPAVATGKGEHEHLPQQQQQQQQPPPQESVFSDEDDDVLLTPPTTAPPTILDEDSDDDERIHGPVRDR